MNDLLCRRLARADQLYRDLVEVLTSSQLGSRLADLPSDTIGHQLWCVLGARESYPRAARAGSWQGFTSPLPLERLTDPVFIVSTLAATAADVSTWVAGLAADDEDGYAHALALLEHETQHHGQLIRYMYGLGIDRPASWQRQYALDEE